MQFEDPHWRLLRPENHTGVGVLLLAGSSGRVDLPRARLLQARGALVLAIRWFGGPGQQPGPFEVPVELFISALDVLHREADRLAIVGTSFGGEAALVTASRDVRIRAAVGFSASSVVWPGWTGQEWASHWTWRGMQLPFVPLDSTWRPDSDPPSFLPLYERALDAYRSDDASIPVEQIGGDVLLVAGGDDLVWPSVRFAEAVRERRREAGLDTVVITCDEAGHRPTLPEEEPPNRDNRIARGGNSTADAALGATAWPAVARVLGLRA